jgi:hypothetical protein
MASRLVTTGDVIRLTNFTHFPGQKTAKGKTAGLPSIYCKAPKDTVFVAVLMGIEPKDGSLDLDLDATMNRLGWFRNPLTKEEKAERDACAFLRRLRVRM